MTDKLLSAKKVAEILDISETQVYRLVQWGHLPKASQVGRGVAKWFKSDVKEYMRKLKYGILPPIPKEPRKKRKAAKESTIEDKEGG